MQYDTEPSIKELIFPKLRLKRYLRLEYGEEMNKKRNIKYVSKFFQIREKDIYTIDNNTWDDLNMDDVYSKLDRNYSSPGESVLYNMLRNPLSDEIELKKRDRIIEIFKKNVDIRVNLQYIFYKLSRDMKSSFLNMIEDEPTINKTKYYIYTVFGKVFPILFIVLAIVFKNPQFILVLFVLECINMYINSKEKTTVKSNGILYLRDLIDAGKRIEKIRSDEISEYTNKINNIMQDIKSIDISTRLISVANMWGGVFEFISVLFLLEETAYYKIGMEFKEKRKELMELYNTIGELEALISISSYKDSLSTLCNKPEFKKKLTLNIVDGIHPLVKNSVPNTINMKKKGMILTGTNMSGKSTFLRMIGINMILAQTFYLVLAKKYECNFFNIVSSISPNDDVSNGKSFYMAEAESLLRIIKSLDKGLPVFCPIDEIFRGTNPVERIAASAEIITYINNRRSISIVATHDRELVDILKDNYEFYYFSENVNKKSGLSFDYKIKEGVSKTRNAIKLLDHIGYPKEIVKKAYKRSEIIEGFI